MENPPVCSFMKYRKNRNILNISHVSLKLQQERCFIKILSKFEFFQELSLKQGLVASSSFGSWSQEIWIGEWEVREGKRWEPTKIG